MKIEEERFEPRFAILFMKEAQEFLRTLDQKPREKIIYNIKKAQAGFKDKEIFKKLENSEIWEFRTIYDRICYRLFAFWDAHVGSLVVATHGIIKKTAKTPKKEIKKAEQLKLIYMEQRYGKQR